MQLEYLSYDEAKINKKYMNTVYRIKNNAFYRIYELSK